MTTFEFQDAEYVAPTGGPGRSAEPNPFTQVVQEIALTSTPDGKPVAKAFQIDHPSRTSEKPEDIAEVVAFLASDRSAWITGQLWSIDGGFFAHTPTMPQFAALQAAKSS